VGIGLAVVRSLAAPQHLRTAQEGEDFEQELVDQYALAMAASGVTDGHLAQQRATVFDSSGSWAAGVDRDAGGRRPVLGMAAQASPPGQEHRR
jgi:hypothetical protein